jgi:hypothetical protein
VIAKTGGVGGEDERKEQEREKGSQEHRAGKRKSSNQWFKNKHNMLNIRLKHDKTQQKYE